MQNSLYGNVNLKDVGKSLIIAGGTVTLGGLLPIIQGGHLPTLVQLEMFGNAGMCAAITYLIKMFLTNSTGSLGSKETNSNATAKPADSGTGTGGNGGDAPPTPPNVP